MQARTSWHAEPNGLLASEVDGLRLVVRAPTKVDGFARFMVLRGTCRSGGDPFALIASGTAENVGEAMGAAERRAASCEAGRHRPAPAHA